MLIPRSQLGKTPAVVTRDEIKNRRRSSTNIEHDDTIIHHKYPPQSPYEVVQPPDVPAKKSSHTSPHRTPHNRNTSAGSPNLFIEQDNWHLLASDSGSRTQPAASRTLFRMGSTRHSHKKPRATCAFLHHIAEDKIEEIARRYFHIDSLGVQPRQPCSDSEKITLKILEENTTKRPTEIKLDRQPTLKNSYEKQIGELLDKGYAEIATTPPKTGRTWCLPHFVVVHPTEPGKVRVMFDAAACSGRTSLNDHLLPSPELLQSLPGVLTKFRQHEIDVAADVQEMFLRIGL
ncbi:hypothetical protein EVAR_84415_1 [Eumeta japonica]|uniref:Uncharacterized protein n=1 Tax=Eumeta variegata TaxID=151549 RepID=A0A4C1W425_EUMVA|nr:hypothetical protein EVAR_84415_1 [Eumeta japonica]